MWPVIFFTFAIFAPNVSAKDHWTQLNIGPYYVASNTDLAAARADLTTLEQLRWVLGNLLETKDLPSLWPIRMMLVGAAPESTNPSQFVWQNARYILVLPPSAHLPLADVAGLLLDANTPRLPPDVESGLRQLFSTFQAHGSRVTWGGPPAHPDLAWARMQLFATKFEYGASFHIFLAALKDGSTITSAEQNAFGKPAAELEKEAQANLAAGHWQAVPVSGRPLDPKRDFGEHSLDPVIAGVYLADATVADNPKAAQPAYDAAVEASGDAGALGYEGLGTIARLSGQNATHYWDDAIHSGSQSAPVYVDFAAALPPQEALPLLKRAAQLNPRWAEPVYQQANLAQTPAAKEALIKTALQLDPRATAYWIELARLQTTAGEETGAQGSWLRAEGSAATDSERTRIQKLQDSSEQQRLDAADAARLRERNAVHLADDQAQQAEADRIRAAEQKANQAVDAEAGTQPPPDHPVDWNSLVREKRLSGTLTRVDCLKSGWRLWVKDKAGAQSELFLSKDSNAELACGAQTRAHRIALEYRAAPDDDLHTIGQVTSLKLQ